MSTSLTQTFPSSHLLLTLCFQYWYCHHVIVQARNSGVVLHIDALQPRIPKSTPLAEVECITHRTEGESTAQAATRLGMRV